MNKPTIIAFYLPQFYPFKENDEWWGKGFTEWTNVGKAKPLFKGHYQPRVPADLGYYDLRLPIVREQQAQMAKYAGVTAFCYWHYWFGNGKRLLADVFNEVLESGKPDFKFCLGWANHSWYAKTWSPDCKGNRLLMKQTYPGIDDAKMHFDYLLKAFKDNRYLKIDGKPFLYIFEPNVPDDYIINFRRWAKDSGFQDLFIVARVPYGDKKDKYLNNGIYDAVNYVNIKAPMARFYEKKNFYYSIIHRIYRRFVAITKGVPRWAVDYRKHYHDLILPEDTDTDVIPTIIPQWDNSPRYGKNAHLMMYNATPKYFGKHLQEALQAIKDKPEHKQILILKSWNEWAEGNYMEPDIKFKHGYIDTMHNILSQYS